MNAATVATTATTARESISFMSACVRFFGPAEGQTKLQFGTQEVKKLTAADRAEMTPELETILGVTITG